MDSAIIAFYKGEGSDHEGRNLGDLLVQSLTFVERGHDYIQWLFPLREPSEFNPDAPLLTDEDIAEFLASSALRSRMIDSLEMMMWFYGLELDENDAGKPVISCGANFAWRSELWLTPGNHNFLRFTRILKSLRLLGSPEYADALFTCLESIALENPDIVGDSLKYWMEA